ncbi:dual specificity phosphatase 12-like isoform X1 [Brachionus plicatilis]|uniref:protein-tyrosine-phosphatase n=1 Tax=Brachionus plicatilis TaxID=10195 RepID=A0A3M7Q137_BRAPC|nr:dual specificity phosphatase 12-like isoform X1 [Brachionus plicatilis]
MSVLKTNTSKINLIIPHLYLGDISAAYDTQLLSDLNITHVLTIEDNELDLKNQKKLEKYKFKKMADHPFVNLLDELDECLERWFVSFQGMSRSASFVIAYIMLKEKQSVKKTLDQVRQKRFVRPNKGFYNQLCAFHDMDFKVSKDSIIYKEYFNNIQQRKLRLGIIIKFGPYCLSLNNMVTKSYLVGLFFIAYFALILFQFTHTTRSDLCSDFRKKIWYDNFLGTFLPWYDNFKKGSGNMLKPQTDPAFHCYLYRFS